MLRAVEKESGTGIRSLVLLFLLIAMITIYMVSSNIAEQRLGQETGMHLVRLTNALESTLARHAYLPKLLAQQDEIVQAALDKNAPTNALNLKLEEANAIAGTSDIYLMDRGGTTIAASNWNSERSFIGKNFAFRPYFKQAVEGKLGRYYALGTTSGERGYYFAYPVSTEGKVRGVMVAKIAIKRFEKTWSREEFEFVVTDEDNIVFMASNPDWRFRTTGTMDTETLVEILESRRYADSRIEPLDFERLDVETENRQHVRIDDERYLAIHSPMRVEGWDVTVFASTASINRIALVSTLAGTVLVSSSWM